MKLKRILSWLRWDFLDFLIPHKINLEYWVGDEQYITRGWVWLFWGDTDFPGTKVEH